MDGRRVAILAVILAIYLCVGSELFRRTEAGKEEDAKQKLRDTLDKFLENNTCVSIGELNDLLNALDEQGQYASLVRANKTSKQVLWDYAGAFTFAVTIVTTIGYGHIVPATDWGRLLTVLYAIIGIPLSLTLLGGLGEKLASLSQKLTKFNIRPDAPSLNKVLNMVILVSVGLVLLFIMPAIVFMKMENWSIMPAFYYCFTTLFTIGFGDYVAGSSIEMENETSQILYRVIINVWIIVGLAYLSLIIKSASQMFAEKAEEVKNNALKRVNTNIKQLSGLAIVNDTARRENDISDKEKSYVKESVQLDEDNNCTLVKVSNFNKY